MNLPAGWLYNLPLSLAKHVCVLCGQLVYCEENWPVKPPKLHPKVYTSVSFKSTVLSPGGKFKKTVTCPDTFGLNWTRSFSIGIGNQLEWVEPVIGKTPASCSPAFCLDSFGIVQPSIEHDIYSSSIFLQRFLGEWLERWVQTPAHILPNGHLFQPPHLDNVLERVVVKVD